MRKFFLSLLLASFFLSLKFTYVKAGLVTVEPDGNMHLNVLSAEEDASSEFKIDNIASGSIGDASIIKLDRTSGKTSLQVYADSGIKSMNVTDYKDTVVEIKERPQTQRVNISVVGGEFKIDNNGTIALTDLPITVDSKSASVSLKTDSGESELGLLPSEAVKLGLRTKLLSSVDSGGVRIINDGNYLRYKISGQKSVNVFNVYTFSIPVSAYISATNGDIVKIDAPGWLKVINFIFT